MAKRTFTSTEKPVDLASILDLPVDMPVAVYYRQSTGKQVGNVSTDMQTIDMVEEMKRRGWSQENILLIDMDAGISGTKKIDEREGMRQLFELISNGAVGAVACVDEDRLFRDVTQIQVNIFIDACFRKQVQVITPSIVYVFHHPMMGEFYKKQFRYKCEMAAEYLTIMRTRMGGAQEHLRRDGKFAGGRMPLGYMVDIRKGSPTHRKLVPWPDIATTTLRVFETFVEVGGHAYRCSRQLLKRGIRYPDFQTVFPPEGFSYSKQGTTKTGYLSPGAIRGMVTNPIYIGHWLYKGEVLIWNNHEPIIPEDLFFQAFNYLSPYSLDGSPNPYYKPVTERTERKPHPEREGVERPLLKGLLHVWYDGKWRRTHVNWHTRLHAYTYIYTSWQSGDVVWSRSAALIDEAVQYHALEYIKTRHDPTLYRQRRERPDDSARRDINALEEQVISLKKQREGYLVAAAEAESPQFRHELEKKFDLTEQELKRTQTLIHEARSLQRRGQQLFGRQEDFEKVISEWYRMSREGRRRMLFELIDAVQVLTWRGRLIDLRIEWEDKSVTECQIWPRRGRGRWSYPEQLTLQRLVRAGAAQEQLLEALPGRKWRSISECIRRFMPDAKRPRPEKPTKFWLQRWGV